VAGVFISYDHEDQAPAALIAAALGAGSKAAYEIGAKSAGLRLLLRKVAKAKPQGDSGQD